MEEEGDVLDPAEGVSEERGELLLMSGRVSVAFAVVMVQSADAAEMERLLLGHSRGFSALSLSLSV